MSRSGDDPRIAPLQLALHVKLVGRLLVCAFGFLDLGIRLDDIDLCSAKRGIHLSDLAPSGFQRCVLFRAVELEDHVVLLRAR